MTRDDEKLSAMVNARVSSSFRLSIDALASATGWRVTDIIRVGLIVFWPDIEAMVLSTKPNPDPAHFADIARTAQLVKQALLSGIDLNAVLVKALEEKLKTQLSTAPNQR